MYCQYFPDKLYVLGVPEQFPSSTLLVSDAAAYLLCEAKTSHNKIYHDKIQVFLGSGRTAESTRHLDNISKILWKIGIIMQKFFPCCASSPALQVCVCQTPRAPCLNDWFVRWPVSAICGHHRGAGRARNQTLSTASSVARRLLTLQCRVC